MSRQQILVIECVCGTATCADRKTLVQNPARDIICSGMLKGGKEVCGAVISSKEAVHRLDRGDKVWVVKESDVEQPRLIAK
jgi:1,2-phenylacetyl-CoA epoxidase PaaB subunit